MLCDVAAFVESLSASTRGSLIASNRSCATGVRVLADEDGGNLRTHIQCKQRTKTAYCTFLLACIGVTAFEASPVCGVSRGALIARLLSASSVAPVLVRESLLGCEIIGDVDVAMK
jgi:hypothetical protein